MAEGLVEPDVALGDETVEVRGGLAVGGTDGRLRVARDRHRRAVGDEPEQPRPRDRGRLVVVDQYVVEPPALAEATRLDDQPGAVDRVLCLERGLVAAGEP